VPVTYTNRKGVTYYLCRGATKTGKPRYYFARKPKDEPVEDMPQGFRISESVNGIVSLVRDRPSQILPQELAAVKAALQRHPKSRNYRVAIKRNRIEVYERVGSGAEELIAELAQRGFVGPDFADQIRATKERHAQFRPVLRFILANAEQRIFHTQRWCYLGSIDDWIYIGPTGAVNELARQTIPTLGSDAFYDLI
jgi:hypothetical protein